MHAGSKIDGTTTSISGNRFGQFIDLTAVDCLGRESKSRVHSQEGGVLPTIAFTTNPTVHLRHLATESTTHPRAQLHLQSFPQLGALGSYLSEQKQASCTAVIIKGALLPECPPSKCPQQMQQNPSSSKMKATCSVLYYGYSN